MPHPKEKIDNEDNIIYFAIAATILVSIISTLIITATIFFIAKLLIK